jgi:hypothetical protein
VTGVAADRELVLRGGRGYGRPWHGDALVCADGFSARYDLDPAIGMISRPAHQLFGQSIVGKVMVFSFAKGGVPTSRFEVDGHAFRYGFERKGWADTFADKLQEHFAAGCLFDPGARRFIAPAAEAATGPTFLEHAADHFERKWPQWSPARRQDAQRELARACPYLVRAEAPGLDVSQRLEADEFLRRALFMVPAAENPRETDRGWQAWFARHSLPLREVNDRHLHAFLEVARTQAVDGTARNMTPTTLARTRAVVRATFTTARKRRLIEWDPWDAVEWRLHADEEQIDPDLVMDQGQVLAIAAACGAIERRHECFVLV